MDYDHHRRPGATGRDDAISGRAIFSARKFTSTAEVPAFQTFSALEVNFRAENIAHPKISHCPD